MWLNSDIDKWIFHPRPSLWCLTACTSPSGWVKSPSLPSPTRLGPSMSVTSSLMTDCRCQLVLVRPQIMFLSFCFEDVFNLRLSTYFHYGMSINKVSSTTQPGMVWWFLASIKVRLTFVDFVSDFLKLLKHELGSLYTDHNILPNFANANLSQLVLMAYFIHGARPPM